MIDPAVVGRRGRPFTTEVERGRLRFFAGAIGETDPVYLDVEAATAAGHPDLPVPPTFLFCLEMDRPEAMELIAGLGIDLGRVLHGEQAFTYHELAYAGDLLTFQSEIVDTYSRKGGALDFLVRRTTVTRAAEPVADLSCVIAVRAASEGRAS